MSIVINVKNNKTSHFWHFMMGEFLPIVFIIARLQPKVVILYNKNRKWGNLFDNFYKELGVEIVFSNKIGGKIRKINYNKWDYKWNEIGKFKCKFAVNYLKYLAIKKYGFEREQSNDVLVQYRINKEELDIFYKKTYGNSGFASYGANRRKFFGMDKLNEFLPNIKYVNTDGLPILEQISKYINHNKIILEHGAGMFFTLFMNKNSRILEFIPPKKIVIKNGAVQGLRRISNLLKFHLRRIIVANKTSVLKKKGQIINFNNNFLRNTKVNDVNVNNHIVEI